MNWGSKLVLGMLLFMAFIVCLAFFMITSSSDDLIEADYYQNGLEYSQEYTSQHAAITDSVVPQIKATQDGLRIRFTTLVAYTLHCKRLSNSALDTTVTGQDSVLYLKHQDLVAGPWLLRLNYQIGSKRYSIKRELVMP